jgi:hypothetical protein
MTLRVKMGRGMEERGLSETCQRGHEWTPENTIIHSGDGARRCKKCQRNANRKPRPYKARPNRPVMVECPKCAQTRDVTQRTALRIRNGETTGLCEVCRLTDPVEVTDELRQWWLDRFTLNEIFVLAAGLASPESEWHDTVPTIEMRAA